jgi:hypothetical protein
MVTDFVVVVLKAARCRAKFELLPVNTGNLLPRGAHRRMDAPILSEETVRCIFPAVQLKRGNGS